VQNLVAVDPHRQRHHGVPGPERTVAPPRTRPRDDREHQP
jgi:hypothetical protein